MKWKKVRPRYRIDIERPVKDILNSIHQVMASQPDRLDGFVQENHAFLRIPEKDQHFWSPELHVTVEESGQGSLVRVVVGPKPKVWTMFMFFYSGVIVLFVLGAMFGLSQWLLGMNAAWLWSVPATLLLWLAIYISALYGQHLAHEQTIFLQDVLDEMLKDTVKPDKV